jgi:hypothetical protein
MPVLLLCLVVHAFFVSATHFHYSAWGDKAPAEASLSSGDAGDSDGAPGQGGHSNCLSCRLQRSFACEVPASCVALEPSGKLVAGEPPRSEAHSHGPFLLLSDRAPPSA